MICVVNCGMKLHNLKTINELSGRLLNLIGKESIIELAKDNYIPYYILTNPITKEDTLLFDERKLMNRVFNSLIVENPRIKKIGHGLRFIYFDKFKKRLADKTNLPEQLSKIKKIYKLNLTHYNAPSAVYFLCDDNKINYIGQTRNIAERITQHIKDNTKCFNDVYFIEVDESNLANTENAFIHYFRPEKNRGNKSPLLNYEKEIIKSLSLH